MRKADGALLKLRKLLASNRFPVNSRLPPERDLAGDLGISRSALRGGLARLEAEGLVWRHVGKGTFVGSRPAAKPQEFDVLSSFTSPSEVLEVRLLTEPRIAGLAALRATAADIAHMERCLSKLEQAIRKGGQQPDNRLYDPWDSTLHRAVAEATHNSMLVAMFNSFNAYRSITEWGRLQSAAMTKERWHLYCEQHSRFVEAIAGRDPITAEVAMREHLETVQRNILEKLHSLPTGQIQPAKLAGNKSGQ
jgi:DNA-binding FadR family transcriptional regulator